MIPLLISLVSAGGPSASKAMASSGIVKRSALTEYVAITSFPHVANGKHYCLRNVGASMAGLELCTSPNMTDSMSLFTFTPADGFGNYTMKSAFDGLCVNFTEGVNPLYLSMADCGSTGTTIPWLFQWNTTDKNPGSGLFASPKYSVISAPYSGVQNINDLSANECYFPNAQGGIDTDVCSDSQQMAWFGYATTKVPSNIPKASATETPCTLLRKNLNPTSHACESIAGGYSIRGLFNSANGRLLSSGSGLKTVNAIALRIPFNMTFKIIPHSKPIGSRGIAEFYEASNKPSLGGQSPLYSVLSIGLSTTNTKLEIETGSSDPSTSSASLPLGIVTQVTISFTQQSILVYFNNTQVMRLPEERFPSSLSFASPPIHKGAIKGIIANATIGAIKLVSFGDQGSSRSL